MTKINKAIKHNTKQKPEKISNMDLTNNRVITKSKGKTHAMLLIYRYIVKSGKSIISYIEKEKM